MSLSNKLTGLLAIAGMTLAALPASAAITDGPRFRVAGLVVVWGSDDATASANVPIVSDFVIDTGTGASAATSGDTDLIIGDVHTVVTGSLQPVSDSWSGAQGAPMILRNLAGQPNQLTDTNADGVMDGADGFGAFRLRQASDTNTRRMEIETSFYVASNAAFNIDAVALPIGSTTALDLERVRLTLTTTQTGDDGIAYGSAAQYPNSGGPTGGSQANNRRLSTLIAGRRVFQGNQRTAAARGSLAEQSVRFDLNYRYRSGNVDLSDGAFEVNSEVIYTVYMP